MVGVAVKVTLVPVHTGNVGLEAMLTDGTGTGLIPIVKLFDVAVAIVGQGAVDVICTVIALPAVKPVVV